MVRSALRVYSFLVHLPLVLFLIGASGVALLSGQHTLHLDLLPWEGAKLTWWMLGLGLAGLAAWILAALGRLGWLFGAWALAVPVVLVRGFFLSPRGFEDRAAFLNALYLTLAMIAAAIGACLPRKSKR